MNKQKGKMVIGMARGLLAVLLSISLPASMVITVQAATVDDLAAYIGDTVNEREVSITIEEPESDKIGGDTAENSGNSNSNTPYIPRVQIDTRVDNLVGSLKSGISNTDTRAPELIATLSEIVRLKEELAAYEKDGALIEQILGQDNHLGETAKKADATKAFETYSSTKETDIEHPYFNIGEIGTLMTSPVKGLLVLESPYGYKVEENGALLNKTTSIDLQAPAGRDIVAQWNGTVTKIRKDTNGLYTVTLYHGHELFTVYSHLEQPVVPISKTINQGDKLGNIGDTTKIETDKRNHLTFEVVYKGKFINPVILYGDNSKPMYMEWQSSTEDVYRVSEDEQYYYTPELSTVNPNKDTAQSMVIAGAAELEGGYSKPNPGVLP